MDYIFCIAQNFGRGNSDRLVSFRNLTVKILMDSLRQPVFAMQFENIERENFDGLLTKCQFLQYSPHQNFALTI